MQKGTQIKAEKKLGNRRTGKSNSLEKLRKR